MHSVFGLGFSMIHYILVLAFLGLKLTFVAFSYNPNITVFKRRHVLSSAEDPMCLNHLPFAMSVKSGAKVRNDPSLVSYIY